MVSGGSDDSLRPGVGLALVGMDWSVAIWLLILLAVASLWVYRQGARINRIRAQEVARILERVLEPEDQTYTWLGGLIGFHAEYSLKDGDRAEATLTLLPRQSLLYYPIARLLTSRHDRLYLLIRRSQAPPFEFHLLHPRRRLLTGRIERAAQLTRETWPLDGIPFQAAYDPGAEVGPLRRWAEALPFPDALSHLAVVPATRTVFLSLKLDLPTLEPLLRHFLALTKRI